MAATSKILAGPSSKSNVSSWWNFKSVIVAGWKPEGFTEGKRRQEDPWPIFLERKQARVTVKQPVLDGVAQFSMSGIPCTVVRVQRLLASETLLGPVAIRFGSYAEVRT